MNHLREDFWDVQFVTKRLPMQMVINSLTSENLRLRYAFAWAIVYVVVDAYLLHVFVAFFDRDF